MGKQRLAIQDIKPLDTKEQELTGYGRLPGSPISNDINHFNFLKDNSPIHIESAPNLHYNLACNITTEDYDKTFISVISETLIYEDTLFISEKTFKAIANNHPFMILGNRNSLKALHKMGYKTFHDLIDESYDNLDSIHRMDAIIDEIRKWLSNPNKIQHLEWMQHIINHNSEVLKFNALFKPPAKFFELLKWIKYGKE